MRRDAAQLADELAKYQDSLLWGQLELHVSQAKGACRSPLPEMTPWRLALALAAGQIVGNIRSSNGRTFRIKGDTCKRKDRSVLNEVDAKGHPSQTLGWGRSCKSPEGSKPCWRHSTRLQGKSTVSREV